MKRVSGKQFARALERHGWRLSRIKGSHHVYVKPGNPRHISLPVHAGEILKPGILHKFMRDAGLRDEDL